MIDITGIDDEELSQTLRRVKAEIITRGWKGELAYPKSAHCFIDRGDGKKLHIFSATPPGSSYAAAALANDKFATYQVLDAAGIPQMDTILVDGSEAPERSVAFMDHHGKIVVKPIDGGHGEGITVGISNEGDLVAAIEYAQKTRSNASGVLLQQQYQADEIYDVRMLCIDYRFVAAILRVPARVYGDGLRTVRTLIRLENESDRRGRAYFSPLATIDLKRVEAYLKDDRMNDVPAQGEEVRVLGVANFGAGGETIDVTDDIPEWLKELAEKTSRTCELPVTGIDVMLTATPDTEATFDLLKPSVTEVNKCPMLALHDMPTVGKSRNAVGHYMDYLASLG